MGIKRIAALLTAALLAVTVLTGCDNYGNANGSNISSSSIQDDFEPNEGESQTPPDEAPNKTPIAFANRLNLTRVNQLIQQSGENITVGTSSRLNRAMNAVANLAVDYNRSEITSSTDIYIAIEYELRMRLDGFMTLIVCRFPSVTELAAGIQDTVLSNHAGQPVTVHSPEEIAAQGAIYLEDVFSGYTSNRTYAASAVQVTTKDGVLCWIVAVIIE